MWDVCYKGIGAIGPRARAVTCPTGHARVAGSEAESEQLPESGGALVTGALLRSIA